MAKLLLRMRKLGRLRRFFFFFFLRAFTAKFQYFLTMLSTGYENIIYLNHKNFRVWRAMIIYLKTTTSLFNFFQRTLKLGICSGNQNTQKRINREKKFITFPNGPFRLKRMLILIYFWRTFLDLSSPENFYSL